MTSMTTGRLLLSCWQLDPVALAVLVATGAAILATRGRRPALHAVPLAMALVLLCLALLSPVGQLADGYLFSAHMLQHLLLVLVVPPLAMLGLPSRNDTQVAPRRTGWLRALLAAPFVTWGLGVGAMWLWHAPTLCNAASNSPLVHRLQELSFLVLGTAFWWPILSPRAAARLPPLGGMVYLFTACTACTLLGILITFSPVEVCSVFVHPIDRLGVMPLVRDGWGLTPERDQQVGGLLMWVPACLVYGVGIMGQLARVFREPRGDLSPGGVS
jgi:cytochrome c oxidase assembly factor CtaG